MHACVVTIQQLYRCICICTVHVYGYMQIVMLEIITPVMENPQLHLHFFDLLMSSTCI